MAATEPTPLSDTEIKVLNLVALGKTSKTIARWLSDEDPERDKEVPVVVTEDVVKNHLRHIFEKLGAIDRANAVKIGIERRHVALASGLIIVSVQTGGLISPTPRNEKYKDVHIAACPAAEACPCRQWRRSPLPLSSADWSPQATFLMD